MYTKKEERVIPKFNLFTVLPDRWYQRINQATRVLSLAILAAFIVFEYAWQPLGGNEFFGFTLVAAALAGFHIIVATIVFRQLSINKSMLAGILSFVTFALMSAAVIHTSRELGTQYIGLWMIVILFAGMFGGLILFINAAIGVLYVLAIKFEYIPASADFNEVIILLNVLVAAASYTLWRSVNDEPMPNEKAPGSQISSELLRSKVNSTVLIESIVDGVVLIDSDGIVQVFNPAAQEITGWDAKEALDLDYRTIIKLQDSQGTPLPKEQDPVSRSFAVGEPIKEDNHFLLSKTNKSIELDMVVSPIKDKGDSIPAVIIVFRDISEQRAAERQRAEFISTASHEMRTPVAAIEGYISLALNEKIAKIDSSAQKYLEKAQSSATHLGKLFQDLLTAAKSEDGRMTNNPVVVEVGKFLRDLTESVRFTAEKKGLVVDYNSSGHSVRSASDTKSTAVEPIYYIHVDPDRMREVITNLFDNAIKYSEEGRITIGMSEDGDNVLMSVKDEGSGIPKEDLPHLFQKFYRVDNTATRKVGGTGLGLFISKQIVGLYGGRIWAESTIGQGSEFIISLPRISASKAQELLKTEADNSTGFEDPQNISSKIDDFAASAAPVLEDMTEGIPPEPSVIPEPAKPVKTSSPTTETKTEEVAVAEPAPIKPAVTAERAAEQIVQEAIDNQANKQQSQPTLESIENSLKNKAEAQKVDPAPTATQAAPVSSPQNPPISDVNPAPKQGES